MGLKVHFGPPNIDQTLTQERCLPNPRIMPNHPDTVVSVNKGGLNLHWVVKAEVLAAIFYQEVEVGIVFSVALYCHMSSVFTVL